MLSNKWNNEASFSRDHLDIVAKVKKIQISAGSEEQVNKPIETC